MNRHRCPHPVFPGGIVVDASDHFVPEHQRLPEGEGTDGAMPVIVQVGPADAAMRDAHQGVVAARGTAGDVVQPEIGGCMDGECFHCWASLWMVSRSLDGGQDCCHQRIIERTSRATTETTARSPSGSAASSPRALRALISRAELGRSQQSMAAKRSWPGVEIDSTSVVMSLRDWYRSSRAACRAKACQRVSRSRVVTANSSRSNPRWADTA